MDCLLECSCRARHVRRQKLPVSRPALAVTLTATAPTRYHAHARAGRASAYVTTRFVSEQREHMDPRPPNRRRAKGLMGLPVTISLTSYYGHRMDTQWPRYEVFEQDH